MAQSISVAAIKDKFGNHWQYHSQSDRHSKIACWAIMFDLLQHCHLLRAHVEAGKIGFGINHEMRDFQTNRKKVLDLVVCTPRKAGETNTKSGIGNDFKDLADAFGVVLTPTERAILGSLPTVPVVPVGSVNVALEAKATMTAHIKALPRLHDELDSSHLTVHGHSDSAIAAALVTINASEEFISTSNNKRKITPETATWNKEPQPKAAVRTISKVREIRRRSKGGDQGFDAMGIVVIDFRNDGSACRILKSAPAPAADDSDHYDNMIGRIASLYSTKFAAF